MRFSLLFKLQLDLVEIRLELEVLLFYFYDMLDFLFLVLMAEKRSVI